MKFITSLRYILLIFFVVFVTCPSLLAQWEPERRLTYNYKGSYRYDLVANGDTLYLAWWIDGVSGIFLKRSTDGGTTWEPEYKIPNTSPRAHCPSVAATRLDIHVVWYDWRTEIITGEPKAYAGIFYNHSNDGGKTWAKSVRLTYDSTYAWYPNIGVSGSNVYVGWVEERKHGAYVICLRRSTDRGESWKEFVPLTDSTYDPTSPSIKASGTEVELLWRDWRDGGPTNTRLYTRRSTDGGVTWGPIALHKYDSILEGASSFVILDSIVHRIDSDDAIWYKRSTDGGFHWKPDTILAHIPMYSGDPLVAVSKEKVHVIWQKKEDKEYGIYYKRNPTGNK